MPENEIQELLELQVKLNKAISELSDIMRQQIDLLVDIKLMEMFFRDTETTDIGEIEGNIFETQMFYEQLKLLDEKFVMKENEVNLLTQKIENI